MRLAAACAVLAVLLVLVTIPAPTAPADAPPRWKPDVAGAREYLRQRRGNVSFAVRTERRLWGHRRLRDVPAASVLKAMLMVAYLNHRRVRDRPLRRRDRRLLAPMIRRSDNAAASAIRSFVGGRGLRRLARRLRMRRFVAVAHPWGHSRVNAVNQTRLFLRIDRHVARRHRRYALRLLRSIVPAQRWGVARAAPRRWRLYFKGGWGSGTGAVDHQVALLRRGRLRVAVAVLTTGNGSHAYGKATLRGVFRRLLRGLGARQRRPSG
jgi:hypothetical protein